jgi:hypothetical protein
VAEAKAGRDESSAYDSTPIPQDEDVTEDEPEPEYAPMVAEAPKKKKLTAAEFVKQFPHAALVWAHGADAVNEAISQRTIEAARKAFEEDIAKWNDDGLDDELPLLTAALPSNPYRVEVQA